MSSQLKSRAARTNGAKSHGPVTPEGKAISSHNAIRHGLTSKMIVLPHEDPQAFEQLRADYVHDFRPANRSQLDLVETMAAARWRLNRMLETEARLFEKELCLRDEDIAEEIKNIDQPGKLAWCLDKMVNESKAFAILIRYEGQLNRSYDRALKQLLLLQRATPPLPAQPLALLSPASPNTPLHLPKLQNEPKPVPEPLPEAQPERSRERSLEEDLAGFCPPQAISAKYPRPQCLAARG